MLVISLDKSICKTMCAYSIFVLLCAYSSLIDYFVKCALSFALVLGAPSPQFFWGATPLACCLGKKTPSPNLLGGDMWRHETLKVAFLLASRHIAWAKKRCPPNHLGRGDVQRHEGSSGFLASPSAYRLGKKTSSPQPFRVRGCAKARVAPWLAP
jgi:hypothetical protein